MASIGKPASGDFDLVARVKGLLLQPRTEWARIAPEPTSIGTLYTKYVVILAAIGPVCMLVGSLLFGYGGFGIVFKPSVGSAVATAAVQYALSLVTVYALALIIDALAPTFNGERNRVQAFKVAAYGSTASWVGGVFGLLPQLSIIGVIAGLYSLYLLYVGLPLLMRVAQEKAVAYFACVVVAAIVLFLVVGTITTAVVGTLVASSLPVASSAGTGTMVIPGGGSVDLSKLEAATRQMEAMSNGKSADGKAIVVVPAATLQGLLPATLAGLPRTAVSSSSGGAAGIGGSTAEGRYGADDQQVTLTVTDLGAAGAFAALGNAFNVESSSQDADGYEKMGKVDGRMTTEKWNTASKSGTYSVLVADRFMVAADGHGADSGTLKNAVASIDLNGLEKLVR